MEEIWKDIIGFEGLYQFSNLYRTRVLFNKYGNISNKTIKIQNKDRYPYINLYKNNKHYNKKIHHLVLEYFVGPRPMGMEACHLNDIKTDYRIKNLRWDTRSNNGRDAVKNNKRFKPENKGSKHGLSKLIEKDIIQIRQRHINGESGIKIAKDYKVSFSLIYKIIKKKLWQHV